MQKRTTRFLLAFFALLLTCVPALAEGLWDWGEPNASETREWTIMAFVNGDNNLEVFYYSIT